jgi:hypothetical protein
MYVDKNIAAIILSYVGYVRYGKLFNSLFPGSKELCYKLNLIKVDNFAYIEYRLFGKLHREDGFAMIDKIKKIKAHYYNGRLHNEKDYAIVDIDNNKCWYVHGKLHRLDGPAVMNLNGTKEWYYRGKYHRLDGPAVYVENNKTYQWYRHGRLHRDGNLPALGIYFNKYYHLKEYYRNGLLHRTDGPAVEISGNVRKWYVNGKFIRDENI